MEDGQRESKETLEVLLGLMQRRTLFVGKLLINLPAQVASMGTLMDSKRRKRTSFSPNENTGTKSAL